jgi:hypothetical protein
MQKKRLLVLFLGLASLSFSQIKGTVTDAKTEALPFVNIFIENTYTGTTTNDAGYYELNVTETKTYTLVFQYLGYKTVKKTVKVEKLPFTLDVILEEENVSLNEVVINTEENPANIIIRQAIAKRKENLEKINNFKADFYSRGLIKIKDAPKKILGQKVEIDGLDSTRTGIFYLSETISKIEFLQPNLIKENITASKVSGSETGFSFNNAIDVDYNFYNNTIEFGNEIISPIANNAFGYYRYKLDGIFYDDRGNLINKIKVTPKRINDPVFSGFIYIIEDQWAIYAIELDITGTQARIPALDVIRLKQNFSYSETDGVWALISQSLDFKYGILGFNGDGRFTAVYSNYVFNTALTEKDFGRQLVVVEREANKKDSLFWKAIRPVPLTNEEANDYVKKDSIRLVKESKPYLDSIDRANNRLKLGSILGYTYQNSQKDFSLGYNLGRNMAFNTVEGNRVGAGLFFRKNYGDSKRYFQANATVNYGFSDERLRATGAVSYKFNNTSQSFLTLSGGVETKQFSPTDPISELENSVASLLFVENYIKLYERQFAQLSYSEELFNGFRLFSDISYERRNALFNTTDHTFFPQNDKNYTSNNPRDENAFGRAPFDNHNIVKLNVAARINFGQNYMSYPDSKINLTNDNYPSLVLAYEKGFGATNTNYNFDQIKARVYQSFTIANKGKFSYNMKAGKFFNADDVAFMDFQHFNGNQINVSLRGNYTDVFNNLPYYDLSTNDSYLEMHAEHDFNGFILGKIPLLNKLNFNLIVGAHNLATPNNIAYQEYTIGIDNIGWGKYRFLRFDYVRSYQNGFIGDAVVFGLKFF